ncbi:hypothetical protein FLO80_19065 [Aquicoccus porphyridii]|uniref:Uncharacterized protein n=1 Tax=Aquicoccus porphyridii TaxID=1852029 RepID=A0A5A9YYM2_9RHOB|nr:hypothetical protein [Aquicoccus porphyridii]KAA0909959.1 hypothetical protein FLO80_19065 [Aquicoccus porphyridii]RAI52057.1 hypothetical protein DOO74_19905 [Rhodobacteraceae bacterium AsT-22]
MTDAMQRRMEAAFATVGRTADKVARKDDKIQREAREAFANTLDIWLDWLSEENPEQIEEIFFEFGCFGNATSRRRLLKHALAPEGVGERIDAQLEEWKAEEEAAKAAAQSEAAAKEGEKAGKEVTAEDDTASKVVPDAPAT